MYLMNRMQVASLQAAVKKQKIDKIATCLAAIVPDLTNQYTIFKVNSEYLQIKVRALHAFQISLALRALDILKDRKKSIVVVDVGDSSGTHLTYLKSLILADQRFNKIDFKFISVNLDPIAIDKVKAKGFEAVLCSAEDIYENYQIRADLFLSFEMLEHLWAPITFLDKVSEKSICDYFIITVPYLRQSRVGLTHIRKNRQIKVYPENTHIFELSPQDWNLIFRHSGWEIIDSVIYRQYPENFPWILMKPVWKKFDFEGFYGVILKRNRQWSCCYIK